MELDQETVIAMATLLVNGLLHIGPDDTWTLREYDRLDGPTLRMSFIKESSISTDVWAVTFTRQPAEGVYTFRLNQVE